MQNTVEEARKDHGKTEMLIMNIVALGVFVSDETKKFHSTFKVKLKQSVFLLLTSNLYELHSVQIRDMKIA